MSTVRGQTNRDGVDTVGARTAIASTSVTRPADTTAYTAGDALSNSTSAPAVMQFTECVSALGSSGVIASATLMSSANQTGTLALDCELWLFSASPTAMEDNAAFDPADAEVATVVGIIPFDTWYVGTATAGAGGNCISLGNKGSFPFVCASGSQSLYGIIVVRNAYTPVSGEILTATLSIYQD